MQPIVLASKSPRRKQLLTWAEIPFEVIVKDTDESFPSDLAMEEVPVFIAHNKALAVRQEVVEHRIILAADTVVVLDDEIIGKPTDAADAMRTLQKLSGKSHRVITGVVLRRGDIVHAFSDITTVAFHALTNDQITYYIEKYQPYDKAGAYAIQEWIGVVGIASVSGDFYNVMGLPISRLVKALQLLQTS
ncbi:MAG: Maf family protein [Chitinophagaceae bacterium]